MKSSTVYIMIFIVMALFFAGAIRSVILDGWEYAKSGVYATLIIWAVIWIVIIIGDARYKKKNNL